MKTASKKKGSEKFDVSCVAFRFGTMPSDKSKRRVESAQKSHRTTRNSKAAGFLLKVVVTLPGGKKQTRYYGQTLDGNLSPPRTTTNGLRPFSGKRAPERLGLKLCRQIRKSNKAKKGNFSFVLQTG